MTTNWGELSAKAIITKLKAKKEVKYSRRIIYPTIWSAS